MESGGTVGEKRGKGWRGKGKENKGGSCLLSSPLVRVSSGCSKGGVRVGDVDQEAEEEEKKKKEKREKGRRG